MIDLHSDDLISITQLAKMVQPIGGKRPALGTVYRWATVGVRGHVLETAFAAGARVTTLAAYRKFWETVSGQGKPKQRRKTKAIGK